MPLVPFSAPPTISFSAKGLPPTLPPWKRRAAGSGSAGSWRPARGRPTPSRRRERLEPAGRRSPGNRGARRPARRDRAPHGRRGAALERRSRGRAALGGAPPAGDHRVPAQADGETGHPPHGGRHPHGRGGREARPRPHAPGGDLARDRRALRPRSRRSEPGPWTPGEADLKARLLLLPLLLITATAAQGHNLGKVQVYASFLKDSTYRIDLNMDSEPLAPGDFGGPAGKTRLGVIAGITPNTEATNGKFLRHFVDGATVSFDGRQVEPK